MVLRWAYSYVRFSTPDQLKGDSLRRQLKLSEDYCQRKGLRLDTSLHLRDLGVSAFRGRNAKEGRLAVFLEAVRMGKVAKGSFLIIESFDRLSRNQLAEAQNLIMQILGAGLTIVTLNPEREYPPEAANDLGAVIEILVVLWRGHEESATKSKRLASAWEHKREIAPGVKVSARCPAWLELLEDRKTFRLRPIAVATLRLIVRLVTEGMGVHPLVRKLNADGVPPIGRTDRWNHGYLNRLFHNRTLLGEYQPRTKLGRKPVGPPLPDYYPAVLTEAEWYAMRQALESRKTQRGPAGRKVASLFTGILFDARDGCTLTHVNKGRGHARPHLVSSGAKVGLPGSHYVGFPYEAVERGFLHFVRELKVSDVLPPQHKNGLQEQRAAHVGRLAELDHKLQSVKKRFLAEQGSDELMDLLTLLEREKKAEAAALEKLKTEEASAEADVLGEAQTLVGLLDRAEGEELTSLRRKVKARVRQLVREMWLVVFDLRGHRLAQLQVVFPDGRFRHVLMNRRGNYLGKEEPEARLTENRDLREFRKKPWYPVPVKKPGARQ